ncbi:MAG: reverse transcriptase family protein [Casimicrobium sp.]
MPATYSDFEPDSTEPSALPLARLAQSMADFLCYSRDQGFALRSSALRERARAHFGRADYMLAAMFDEFECDEAPWRNQPANEIAKRILASEVFVDLQMPIDEDAFWYADDDELTALKEEREGFLSALTTLPSWQAPSSNAYEWLHGARATTPSLKNGSDIAHWLDVSRDEWESALNACGYRLRVHRKANGKLRLLEIPPESKRVLQRRLLHRLLDRVTPHDAAHGFVLGRSVHTHARAHTGKRIVIRLDLADFFASTAGARVFLLFRALGLNANVSNALTELCTTSQSRNTLHHTLGLRHMSDGLYERYSVNHLPQGAPTSPALANLCAHALDVRLSALATEFGANYTRYADDLVFSGDDDIAKRPRRFISLVREIIANEGWQLNPDKTRIMRDSGRQSFTGLVVNERVNVARDDYDRIKAAVHRATADDVSRVLGLLSWLKQSSPQRAEKLRAKLLRNPATMAAAS